MQSNQTNNKLIIAAAGSGKTTFLVEEALKQKEGKVLITTYTQANEAEIKKKIIEKNKCIPENITVQTWFSFLLKHGVRPFQRILFDKKIKGLILMNEQSGVKYRKGNIPICFNENTEFEQHYFSKELKIYSDKLSKFVYRCNKESKNSVIDRIARIYSHILIDEIQDLAGYDLELLKLLFNTQSEILLVGDPRQVTYLTHNERKYSKYTDGKIKEFIENECKKKSCTIDDTSLNKTYRNNREITQFSAKLFPDFPSCESLQSKITRHDGIFFIKQDKVDEYLKQYNPIQLRDSKRNIVNENYNVMTFGESKGLSFDRVLIYPTQPFISWLKDNNSKLAPISRSKFYVAITRARHSVAIVNDDENTNDDIRHYVLE